MAITGSGLYLEVSPILDKGSISWASFRLEMGNAISTYVSTNAVLAGVYAGTMPHGGTSPLVEATGVLVPTNPLPAKLDEPVPYNFIKWIKNTLTTTVLWNIEATVTHTSTPVLLVPKVSLLDGLGDFSDLRTARGFWALTCDGIIDSILAFPSVSAAASAIDGSSGTIAWTTTKILSTIKHNFILRITYDINNSALIRWIRDHITNFGDFGSQVDIPINDVSYQTALATWKTLTAITKECEFYKKQDNDELILLRTGSQV